MVCQRRAGGRREAFTLVELLVVLAAIALLIAILAPAVSRARAQGRNAACLSNLHQLGVAAAAYATQNRGVLRAAADVGEPSWIYFLARELNERPASYTQVPVDRMRVAQCPERASGQPLPFLGYLVNGMNPAGPRDDGNWIKNPWIRLDRGRRANSTVYLVDAEREDMVVYLAGHDAMPTVKLARINWYEGRHDEPTLDAMDVVIGAHLPQGKECVNDKDSPDVRRAARKLHLRRFTNTVFLDGSARSLATVSRDRGQLAGQDGNSYYSNDEENYAFWLGAFGVRDVERAKKMLIQ